MTVNAAAQSETTEVLSGPFAKGDVIECFAVPTDPELGRSWWGSKALLSPTPPQSMLWLHPSAVRITTI